MGTPSKKELRRYFDNLADAYTKLSKIRSATIKDIYDEYSTEILIICPNFEYPDWSYKTVGTFLRDMEEGNIDLGENNKKSQTKGYFDLIHNKEDEDV